MGMATHATVQVRVKKQSMCIFKIKVVMGSVVVTVLFDQ